MNTLQCKMLQYIMDKKMKLLDLNIEGDNHFERIFPLIDAEKPDVICMQEVFQDDIDMIKSRLGFECRYQGILSLAENSVNLSPKGIWGIAIFTRFPIVDTCVEFYVKKNNFLPQFHGEPNSTDRAILIVDMLVGDEKFRIATTHFTWSPGGSVTDEQRHDLTKLLAITDRYTPMVLTGDFNAPRGKEIFDTLTTKFKDNIPPEVQTSIDPNLHRKKNLQFMVDGLFTSPEYTASNVRVISGVSDHQAIVAEVDKQEAKS